MTLGNMRENGVRSVACVVPWGRIPIEQSVLNVDHLADDLLRQFVDVSPLRQILAETLGPTPQRPLAWRLIRCRRLLVIDPSLQTDKNGCGGDGRLLRSDLPCRFAIAQPLQ